MLVQPCREVLVPGCIVVLACVVVHGARRAFRANGEPRPIRPIRPARPGTGQAGRMACPARQAGQNGVAQALETACTVRWVSARPRIDQGRRAAPYARGYGRNAEVLSCIVLSGFVESRVLAVTGPNLLSWTWVGWCRGHWSRRGVSGELLWVLPGEARYAGASW